ncbi:serine hydrolase [Empedobacter tilapiae]|uniref:serine hydrolase n=1 Tax=Empedobacter tilapiae TaxID=2491114 RepID=UPI0028D80CDF|nr:serine hydrolase [Empedobacter tilapiae]
MRIRSFYLSFVFNFFAIISYAQNQDLRVLNKTILANDSLLFDVGFNQCDISQFENLLSNHLKFYHDKDGVSTKTKFISDLKNGICNHVDNRQVKRFLIKDKTEIFPLYKNGIIYGAIQNGEHTFSEKRESQQGVAKFSNVWILENKSWKLVNSFSFDHQTYKDNSISTGLFESDSLITKWLDSNHVKTLGLGIIEDGKLQQIKVIGQTSEGNSAPYNSIFNVASLTKPITVMVALRLASLGKWNLDEPIYHFYTDFDISLDVRNKQLTTTLILSHQTGFPNWRSDTDNKKLQFIFDPGTKYGYSGEGFEYLRKALEKKFKKSLNELAQELIFEPLKMHDTEFLWTKNTDESRFVMGYDRIGNAYETVKNKKINAADDLHTTIADYGNFLVNVLNGGNLSEDIFRKMTQQYSKIKENEYFGLGWIIYDLGNNEFAISHSGADKGSQCLVVLLPQSKKGVLIFTNSDEGYKVYNELLMHYLGEKGKRIIEIEN